MHKLLRALLSSVVFVAGALAMPSTSMARDQLVCTFSGATTALTDIPGILGSEQQLYADAIDDSLSAVPGNQAGETGAVIENGNYAFASAPPFFGIPTQCLHIDTDGLIGLDPDFRNDTGFRATTVSANGIYSNILCGTGLTNGAAIITLSGDPEIGNINANYSIAFATGNGPLEASGVMGPGARPVNGAGAVHIEGKPVTAGATACMNSDAADFNVFGSVTFTT